MIAKLCGLALDARVATRTDDAAALARAAKWIAGNLLGIRGRAIAANDPGPIRVIEAEVATLDDLLARLAAQPALVDPATLPATWRFYLRAVGMPLLDRPVDDALAGGASVLAIAIA